jgi:tRNA(Ile)-lysidine synthase
LSRGGRRSHPPSLLRIVERTVREECRLGVGDGLLLAVSGGGDSMAMLHVMARLAPRFGIGLFAHGVDHGLRAEASAELDLAQALATELGIEFSRTELVVARGSNLQARAREVRYAALKARATALGCAIIATAHHADDRAETVILRLLRGAGLAGLGVLPAREGHLLRPLVRARRSDILAHLARHELDYASDPSNENTRYLRVKVRQELMPLLIGISPGIVEHLGAIADQASATRGGDADAAIASKLGRRQRVALARAIDLNQDGFELPIGQGLTIRLERSKQR